ncbi:orotate phosphoribosyltransferase [Sedimentisphaera salicampi]|uniref:Orotate phosphoribosyltransferase n=1 Tax=Sedimentisphaera salicampi TaxID=1941349 RepID=A0A1W6LPV3_9BACT|nr:orotate phosphoribosyltransferase [Sedimentisphaera salicampi]ARN57809.1 Orotate phosphoribosyltransferase [Sedimentisphaera salicampi]
MNKQDLTARIKQEAYLEGDFTLRSGKKSHYYLDKYLFEACPDILKALGEEFAKYADEDVTMIAGPELGGVALAASASIASGKKWVIIRNSKKGYGTGNVVEGGEITKNDVVLLVEDIATTGGQVIEAAKVIREAGAKVKKIVAVIDRKQGAEENIKDAGFEFASIITKEDLGIKD